MTRTVGIEIELLCPEGRSRQSLAEHMVELRGGGEIRSSLHYDTEVSLHPEIDVFHNVSPALDVVDPSGSLLATLRDDSSIVEDLRAGQPGDGEPAPLTRIVSDDRRLLRLIGALLDPSDPAGPSLGEAFALLGLTVLELEGGRLKIIDEDGETVALTGSVPGRRRRVAEIVSPLLGPDTLSGWLDLVCRAVADHGCRSPIEGAVHLHFDAEPFDRRDRFARLVRWFDVNHDSLRHRFGTNPRCRTLGQFDPAFVAAATEPSDVSWDEQRLALFRLHRTRHGDVNLTGLLHQASAKPTIEIRFLPVSIDPGVLAGWIYELGGTLQSLAHDKIDVERPLSPPGLDGFLHEVAGVRSLGPDE